MARTVWLRGGAYQDTGARTIWTVGGAINSPSPIPSPGSSAITQRRIRLTEEAADDEIWRPVRVTTTAGAPAPPPLIIPVSPRRLRLGDLDDYIWRRSLGASLVTPAAPSTPAEITKLNVYAILSANIDNNVVSVTKFNAYAVLNADPNEDVLSVTKFNAYAVLNADPHENVLSTTKFNIYAILGASIPDPYFCVITPFGP